jgi:hypothetical protein
MEIRWPELRVLQDLTRRDSETLRFCKCVHFSRAIEHVMMRFLQDTFSFLPSFEMPRILRMFTSSSRPPVRNFTVTNILMEFSAQFVYTLRFDALFSSVVPEDTQN